MHPAVSSFKPPARYTLRLVWTAPWQFHWFIAGLSVSCVDYHTSSSYWSVGQIALPWKQRLFCILFTIKRQRDDSPSGLNTPPSQIDTYKESGTFSAQCLLPNLIQTTVGLYGPPLILILSRIPRPRCPAKDHAPFSSFPLLFYTHPAEMFSGQELISFSKPTGNLRTFSFQVCNSAHG